MHASTLPLLLAVRHGKRRLEDGLRLEHDFLKRAGLDADSISFGGGAGGSPADFTTPRVNVALLRSMSTAPISPFTSGPCPFSASTARFGTTSRRPVRPGERCGPRPAPSSGRTG